MLEKHKEELSLQISLEKKQYEAKEKEFKETKTALENMCEKLERKIKLS